MFITNSATKLVMRDNTMNRVRFTNLVKGNTYTVASNSVWGMYSHNNLVFHGWFIDGKEVEAPSVISHAPSDITAVFHQKTNRNPRVYLFKKDRVLGMGALYLNGESTLHNAQDFAVAYE